MDTYEGPVVPESDATPDIATLAADPEIAALLGFEPVPIRKKVNGWDTEAQRAFVALLAMTGSKLRAARAIGRKTAGIDRVLKKPEAASFAAAVDGAIALAARRNGRALAKGVAAAHKAEPTVQASGQVLNEIGEWEDEASYLRRAEEAKDSIGKKLLRIRRLFLQDISACPGKRAAFEILTELPIDWEIAERGEPQPDEPYRSTNQREPEMVLMAESGWSAGDIGYGPNRKTQARRDIDDYRAEQGLPPVNWSESTDPGPQPGDAAHHPSSPPGGEGRERGPNQ